MQQRPGRVRAILSDALGLGTALREFLRRCLRADAAEPLRNVMAYAAPSGSACTAPVRDRLSARCVSLAVLGADRVARCQDDHQDEQSVRQEVSHLEGSGRRLSLSRSAHDLLLKVTLPPERSFRAELFSFLGLF